MNTIEKLNKLSELQAQLDVIRLRFEELRNSIIPPEIKEQLDDMDIEQKSAQEPVQEYIEKLTAEIKQDVIKEGTTAKGDFLMAVWNKGRVSWDTKGLDGYAVAHPEMSAFRKEGDPTVTIRKV